MSPKKDSGPSYEDYVREILREANGPVLLDDLVNEVLKRHPTTAKNPRHAVVSKMRYMEGESIVRPDADHVLSIQIAFQGARFRIRLNEQMVEQGNIPFLRYFDNYLPRRIPHESLRFQDEQGRLLDVRVQSAKRRKNHPLLKGEDYEYEEEVLDVKDWFRLQQMQAEDHLLVTLVDRERGLFRLEREPASAVNHALLAERNRQFADILFELLESSRGETLWPRVALPTAYAVLPDKAGYPPDELLSILHEDKRMGMRGFDITYYDPDFDVLSYMIEEEGSEENEEQEEPVKELSKEEGEKVYRFRVELKRRPGIWREIEVQGKQTLSDLDLALRGAFNHDSSDHLSGFWKLVARRGGKRTNYREVDIATIDPFGGEEGEGAGTRIAELDLQVNDRLKYVYDFGDWVEHVLTLKAIAEPEKKVTYPREAARNTPKIQYCTVCQEEDKKVAAKWVCVTCSNELGVETLLCDEHAADEEHEDHYTVEILS